MCEPASLMLTETQILWSKVSESHEVIKAENPMPEFFGGKRTFVLAEITPPDGDFTKPISEWKFRFDDGQNFDNFPAWATPEECERRARLWLPEWIESKIILPGQEVESVTDGRTIVASYGTIQSVEGGTIQYVEGGTIQYVYGGTIQIYRPGIIDPAILKSSNAVLIDRSGPVPVCYVGKS